jgi:hypothetical protein
MTRRTWQISKDVRVAIVGAANLHHTSYAAAGDALYHGLRLILNVWSASPSRKGRACRTARMPMPW